MRFLFAVSQLSLLRHFESVVAELARRGHDVTLVTQERSKSLKLPEQLEGQPRITLQFDDLTRRDERGDVLKKIRAVRDYLRYRTPPFAEAGKLRRRAFRKMVQALSDETLQHLVASVPGGGRVKDEEFITTVLTGFGGEPTGAAAQAFLARLEDTIGADAGLNEFLRRERFDAVIVTPLVNFGTAQPEIVKSARAVGIPSIFPVFSWDNLTTKGLIHVQPDALLVWNEVQRDEAVQLHGVPADRVVVTGAPRFDEFVSRGVADDRRTFCARHGLDPAQPLIAYVGSSEFVSGHEPEFVATWLDSAKAHSRLANAGVVIRPHPRMRKAWDSFDATRWPGVAVQPSRSAEGDQTLRDLLEHAAAVVGLNTSAELEAGLVGRPVLTVVASDHADGQQSTLHFHYLLEEAGGFVKAARSLDEHVGQLASTVDGAVDTRRIRDFMQRFVRPAGWQMPVTPIVADVIERHASLKAR